MVSAAPPWHLVQYVDPDGSTAVGVMVGEDVHQAPRSWPAAMLDMLNDWDAWESELRTLDVSAWPIVLKARLLAPITFPRKVLCAGANYYDHAAEMGTAPPDPNAPPFFFLKPPTTTIVGPGDDVVLPASPDARVDWEGELGVVIGRRSKDLTADTARSVIAGYVVANDISARGLFSRPDAVFPAFSYDWLAHKGMDTFCPVGPGLVPWWLAPDIDHAGIRVTVDGTVRQDSSLDQIVLGIDGLVAAASRLVTLEPGDLILTGTPAGVGLPKNLFLRAGDLVTVEIDGVGRIENRVVAP